MGVDRELRGAWALDNPILNNDGAERQVDRVGDGEVDRAARGRGGDCIAERDVAIDDAAVGFVDERVDGDRQEAAVFEPFDHQAALVGTTRGGAAIAGAAIDAGLVDELRLIVYPLIVGEGKALFSSSARHAMELHKVEQLPDGRLSLVYGIGQ